MKNILLIFSLILIAKPFSFGQQFTDLYGDYLGQTPPGDTAIIFAPGIISLPNRLEKQIVFSPDGKEIYIGAQMEVSSNVYSTKIYYTKRVNNTWTEQVEVPFLGNQNTFSPFLSADGNRLYFTYNNPINIISHIYFVERTAGRWGEPQILPSPINSTSSDQGYAETDDNTIYISSNRSGNWNIWCIRRLSDQTLQAQNLGPIVNSTSVQVNPWIAPDGSYLIFTTLHPGDSYYGLYIIFNKGNGEWTVPLNMNISGARINIFNQGGVTISPDKKYLFFTRGNNPVSGEFWDVYWVSIKVIDDIKKEALNSKVTK